MSVNIIRRLYWELTSKPGLFQYFNGIVSNIPGLIGYSIRRRFVRKFFKKAGKNITIHPGVRLLGVENISVDNDTHIGIDNILQGSGGIVLGKHVLLGPGVKIWSVNHVFEDVEKPILEQGYDHKEVVIGDFVWVGANSFIMPGVTLPEGCIVSAGSVVGVKQYKPYSIIAGNPARVIGSRKPQDGKS